jgi:hypothetical protein
MEIHTDNQPKGQLVVCFLHQIKSNSLPGQLTRFKTPPQHRTQSVHTAGMLGDIGLYDKNGIIKEFD